MVVVIRRLLHWWLLILGGCYTGGDIRASQTPIEGVLDIVLLQFIPLLPVHASSRG